MKREVADLVKLIITIDMYICYIGWFRNYTYSNDTSDKLRCAGMFRSKSEHCSGYERVLQLDCDCECKGIGADGDTVINSLDKPMCSAELIVQQGLLPW